MRSEPHKSSSETELYTAALRALMRRAHSTFELRTTRWPFCAKKSRNVRRI